MKRFALLFAALFSLSLVASACGGGNGDTPGTGAGTTPGTPEETTPTETTATETPSDGGTSGETRLAMEDFMFVPANLSVTTGSTIELDNEGEAPHTFTVEGQDIDVTVNAGENGTATIDLPAGTYPYICMFHEGQGMVGELTVTG